ncbi:MAG: nicotinate phosphoribosyltransferase [Pseudonocardiales bacterium]|nr:nicotinate phosphoribosyltransferase [Pseudonocardiales bacterium]MBV9032193.1 nicotinate phosphoribosyltransferase [Pseudonocardiales bacterium]MBW0011451.1 nicotinate phosphoribosyltransferase [Pseudonocardiales bacterium]
MPRCTPNSAAPLNSTALLTDHYALTMLAGALADGSAFRRCTFEVFARGLRGHRYGIVAGVPRLLDAVARFQFGDEQLAFLGRMLDARTLDWLAGYRFRGDIDGYPEGELYFPGSPVLTVTGSFAEAVMLETLVLSVLNHDSAVAAAAARMASAAGRRPLVEMGSRRTHEEAAVAAARAAYLGGFSATSNLAAGQRYGIPTTGTAAHAFSLLHEREADAFTAQVQTLGTDTTLLVDTYDITQGIATAIEVAGPGLRAIRIDSGNLGELARQAREQLDRLGAPDVQIVVSGDLDEYSIAALRAEPVDSYGVGTSVVTGSGEPSAGMVYKLVEVDGRPVAKRSTSKISRGGAKSALRRYNPSGTAIEEVVLPRNQRPEPDEHDRVLPVPLLREGHPVGPPPTLHEGREHVTKALATLPCDGLRLSPGEPALPTVFR